MPEHKVGERVGAMISKSGKECQFLGYGVYEGDHPLEMAPGLEINNPRIKLDSGETVWGAECWWGDEASVKRDLETFKANGGKIVNVSIEALRRKENGESLN